MALGQWPHSAHKIIGQICFLLVGLSAAGRQLNNILQFATTLLFVIALQ